MSSTPPSTALRSAASGPQGDPEHESRPRVEGRSKVTGTARYVDDVRPPEFGSDFDVAVPVTSTRATGRITGIDVEAALAVPGVQAVMTHRNAPRLRKVLAVSMAEVGGLLPLQDDRVHYHGQCVAVVVATSLRAAQDGARRLAIRYDERGEPGAFTLADATDRLSRVKRAGIAPGEIVAGDAEADYRSAPVRIDLEYHHAAHHHNAIEPSAVLARWDPDGGVTIRAAVQWHHIDTLLVGQAFGLGPAHRLPGLVGRAVTGASMGGRVRLVNALSGGAFGRNLNTVHLLLACMAAKLTDRAVKVVLSREQTFSLLSYRGEVAQRLRLGAADDGRLITMIQEPDVAKGAAGTYVEPVGEVPCQIYVHHSRLLRHRVAALDLGGTGWMRAPGVSSGVFALETAMDDLARRLGVDPVELRLRNYAETNPENGKPWTSKSLRQCYATGAEAIGWADRPTGGSLRPDGRLVGYGMATSFDLGRQFPAAARVELRRDGGAVVSVAAAELGQGIFSALTTISADALGLDRNRIALRTAETALPYAAGSIGSTGTFSNGTAIHAAAQSVRLALLARAVTDRRSPLHRHDPSTLTISDGRVLGPDGTEESVAGLMARHPRGSISRTARTGRTFGRSATAKASFGAVFVELSVDPITMVLTVERTVGAFACGRIVEPVIARSQITGGLIWGIGQALFEETRVDRRTGRWVNANLAEALVATQADVRSVEVHFVEEDDTGNHPLGMKGLAEIGVVGTAPAISNAIADATGTRLTSTPMLLENRLRTPMAAHRALPVLHDTEVAR